MPFTPACPSCGGTDCEEVDDYTFACNDCEFMFNFDGEAPEELSLEPEGLELDMQEFEDRLSCIGDD